MRNSIISLLFLLVLGAFVENSCWGQVGRQVYLVELDNYADFSDPHINGQYYVIGIGAYPPVHGSLSLIYEAGVLTADGSGSSHTVLSSASYYKFASITEEELSAMLWRIEPYKEEGSASYSGYRLMNKKTGKYLKLNADEKLPTQYDDPAYSVFGWFPNAEYNDNGALLTVGSYALTADIDRILIAESNKASIRAGILPTESATDEKHKLHIYRVSGSIDPMLILNANQVDGFTLQAIRENKAIDVAENPFLNQKLTAISFRADNDVLAKKLITFRDNLYLKTTYFVVDGAEELLQLSEVVGKEQYVNITSSNHDKILKAFEKASFLAVDNKVIYQNPTGETLPTGLGYAYGVFTGKSLLEADETQVPIENARFRVVGVMTDSMAISNPYAKFPENGSMTKQITHNRYFNDTSASGDYVIYDGVRPFVLTDNVTKQSILMTAPANGKYEWTQIGFSPTSGTIPSDSFKEKNVAVTVADQEIRKSGEDVVLETVRMEGWKINPSSTSQAIKDNRDQVTGYTNTVRFSSPNDLLSDRPEGVWTLTKEGKFFLLTNRETGNAISLGQTIYQVAEDLYRLATPLEGDYLGQSVKIDSLRLTEVQLGELDGYAHSKQAGDAFDGTVLASTPYKLAIQNATFDGSLLYTTSYTGELAITSKSDEGLSFILTPCDTIPYGIYTMKDAKPVYDLRRVRYALQEQQSGKYLLYDRTLSVTVLDPSVYNSSAEALSKATKFYLKEKGTDQYELVVSMGYNDATNNNAWVETGGNLKLYTNSSGKLSGMNLYTAITGDKFGFFTAQSTETTDNILNKLIGKSDTTLVRLNFLSTMNGSGSQPWMLAVDNDRFLVEGQPISKPNIDIGTKAQGGLEYEPVNFSLILDTAYVQRAGVTTPLYYIAMPSDKTSEQIQQVGKKTVGYYLFAMTDSIYNSVDKNREDRYCYHFWSQHNPRLRFVQATHEGDTIYIETANPSAKDTIQAGSTEGVALAARQRAWLAAQSEGTAGNPQNNTNQGINYGLFAFEANPKAAEGSLEYALWNPASNRYVTYLNGNVMLTQEPTYYKLDVSRPDEGHFVVANEPVVAEPEPFAVVGGIGQVEIRQAAGKQVHIYNILGKELAHRRLTSDREQIALPKGIAIVAVEGETPVKAIVQ